MAKVGKRTDYHMVQKIGKNQNISQGWLISEKNDILTVEGIQIDLIGNITKRSLEVNPWKIELEARRLKA